MLASYAAVTSASILSPSGGLFSAARKVSGQSPLPYLAQTWLWLLFIHLT